MTDNSLICKFIKENENWDELLKNMNIHVGYDRHYAIFNHGKKADLKDPIVQEANGIIIDIEKCNVACWPFREIGNYGESYADEIDWRTARVEEQIDGLIIKRWYDLYTDTWKYSTDSMIDAINASVDNTDKSIYDCITETDDFAIIQTICRNKALTYIFELVHADVQNTIVYPANKMYFIGLRNNITGEECMTHTVPFLTKPKIYGCLTLEKCIREIKELNKNGVQHKGFVVVDKEFHRLKVQSPIYALIQHILNNGDINDGKIMEMMIKNKIDINRMYELSPEIGKRADKLTEKINKIKEAVKSATEEAMLRYDQIGKDRKAFALLVKDSPYRSYMFRAIDGEHKIEETLTIRDYERFLEG